MSVRTRIAPSPTGIAHLGTAYTAMRNLAIARQNKGQFIVRIEDTDRARFVEGAVEVIFEAMKWLGLAFDEGPYTQSEHLPIYQDHAKQLVEKGQAYYCFCTKERLNELKQAAIAKKELLAQFQQNWKKYWDLEILKDLDFKRQQCKNCGKFTAAKQF